MLEKKVFKICESFSHRLRGIEAELQGLEDTAPKKPLYSLKKRINHCRQVIDEFQQIKELASSPHLEDLNCVIKLTDSEVHRENCSQHMKFLTTHLKKTTKDLKSIEKMLLKESISEKFSFISMLRLSRLKKKIVQYTKSLKALEQEEESMEELSSNIDNPTGKKGLSKNPTDSLINIQKKIMRTQREIGTKKARLRQLKDQTAKMHAWLEVCEKKSTTISVPHPNLHEITKAQLNIASTSNEVL